MTSSMRQGIGASEGIAIGRVMRLENNTPTYSDRSMLTWEAENERFIEARQLAGSQIEIIREKAKLKLGETEAQIFDAHLAILSDDMLLESVQAKLAHGYTAESATQDAIDEIASIFAAMEDQLFRERASDIKDIGNRLIRCLTRPDQQGLADNEPDVDVILVCEDLTPSDTMELDLRRVMGFLTASGGPTSHSAILARTMGIPAVVGAGHGILEMNTESMIVLDGTTGVWEENPSQARLSEYHEKALILSRERAHLMAWKGKASVTADGKALELAANIGLPKDVEAVLAQDAEGIGLFRTEFLYMNHSDWPSETEQYEAYSQVLEAMGDKPVIIRTLDIGGDKHLPYYEFTKEMNPFLGNRAIRLCLSKPEIFRVQIRALLRAGLHGNLKIMIPMISSIEELRSAKREIETVKQSLRTDQIPFAENVPVGIMVEVPSVAIMAHQFAKEVDFFSIGTNDLTQYTLACDRMNSEVEHLYSTYHPAVIQLVANVAKFGLKEGIMVGMCGEAASDPLLVPVWIGAGLTELSMSASKVLKTREGINRWTQASCREVLDHILTLTTPDAVKTYLSQLVDAQV